MRVAGRVFCQFLIRVKMNSPRKISVGVFSTAAISSFGLLVSARSFR